VVQDAERNPDRSGYAGDQRLHVDAGGRNRDAVPLILHAPGVGDIHIGRGLQIVDHQTGAAHGDAETGASYTVADFVQHGGNEYESRKSDNLPEMPGILERERGDIGDLHDANADGDTENANPEAECEQ